VKRPSERGVWGQRTNAGVCSRPGRGVKIEMKIQKKGTLQWGSSTSDGETRGGTQGNSEGSSVTDPEKKRGKKKEGPAPSSIGKGEGRRTPESSERLPA